MSVTIAFYFTDELLLDSRYLLILLDLKLKHLKSCEALRILKEIIFFSVKKIPMHNGAKVFA